ncbi:MAG: Crp/Fnr family transcriptional regulator [Nitriliruptorales bacterium]|nr:Crp/Fnr family transcriptional regulator [Nitriliruptorales bacterium]
MEWTLRPDQWADLPAATAAAGTVLLRAGDVSSRMLVLVEGELVVQAEGRVVTRLREPGTVVGEMSGLLGTPRTATVVADTDVAYREVDDVIALMAERPDVAMAVARTLAHRLDLVQSYLVDVRRQYADRDDQLGAVDAVLTALASAPSITVDVGSDREREPNV